MKPPLSQVTFGVLQGSILGPVLLKLYAFDMKDTVSISALLQYAGDTMFCGYRKVIELKNCNYKSKIQ